MNPSFNLGASDAIQFDHMATLPAADAGAARTVTCSGCRATLTTAYFNVNGLAACARCKSQVEEQSQSVREWGTVLRAGAFGFGAALVGAAVYYGVIALTGLEIGLVAILSGYLVGGAVRKGAGDRGGRRLQVLAVALVYLSIAFAYAPLAVQSFMEANKEQTAAVANGAPATAQATDADEASGATEATPAAASLAAEGEPKGGEPIGAAGMLVAFGAMLFLTLALPVISVVGSLPGGLISAAIMGFGMHQAWKMTGAVTPTIQGPFRVAPAEPASGAVPA